MQPAFSTSPPLARQQKNPIKWHFAGRPVVTCFVFWVKVFLGNFVQTPFPSVELADGYKNVTSFYLDPPPLWRRVLDPRMIQQVIARDVEDAVCLSLGGLLYDKQHFLWSWLLCTKYIQLH